MASPQLENGYTKIANEILEALSRVPSLGSEAFQILMLIIRYCYGFQRKKAELSISFIAKGTGMRKRNVSRAIERLVSKRMIVREKSMITFNKNHDEWVVSKRTGGVQTDRGGVSKRMKKVVSNRTDKKDNYKENYNKENKQRPQTDADEINLIMEKFQIHLNQNINYGNKTQRQAIKFLLKKHGIDKLKRLILFCAKIQNEQFAPIVTTPWQLKEKEAQIAAYWTRKNNSKDSLTVV